METNAFQQCLHICNIVRCWWSKWSVSFQILLLLLGLPHFVLWNFAVHHLHLL
jgi:hypothetical protein